MIEKLIRRFQDLLADQALGQFEREVITANLGAYQSGRYLPQNRQARGMSVLDTWVALDIRVGQAYVLANIPRPEEL